MFNFMKTTSYETPLSKVFIQPNYDPFPEQPQEVIWPSLAEIKLVIEDFKVD